MKCKKCGKTIDVSEANEYYFGNQLIHPKDLDMYLESKITVVCQRCI